MNDGFDVVFGHSAPQPDSLTPSDDMIQAAMLRFMSRIGYVLDEAAKRPIPDEVTSGYAFVDYLMKEKRI